MKNYRKDISMVTVQEWLGTDNPLGEKIFNSKYKQKNETLDDFFDRVSGGDHELRQLIFERKILLGGRTFANRGIENGASFFNCYSEGFIADDYREIMQTAVDIGLTFKGQGGQGISLSKLRPKGTPIGDTYTSDGIIPFMKIYNEVTAGTSQGGARKGALMISLDARHKEAPAFISIKAQDGVIEKANLSLEIDDEFMQAVEKYFYTGEVVVLHEKREYSGHVVEYDVTPIDVFNALVDNCYDWGDPAALFVNRFRNYNLMELDDEYQIETSNPCGEQPLPKGGACCLASINLSEFVVYPYEDKAFLDFSKLLYAVQIGVRTLDKLIDENYYRHPLARQQQMSFDYRNIGLGCCGYATMLMKLGMRYGSDEAIKFTDDLFAFMFRAAVIASNNLAKELGPFPKYKECIWDSEIIRKHFAPHDIECMKPYGLRNCSLLSIAPTGSISNLINESGGCEPEFALSYTRKTEGLSGGEDAYYTVYCRAAREYMAKYHTDNLPDYFVAAEDIPWLVRVKTQAAMQEHVDTAISSTINLPVDATKEDIAGIYLESWRRGIKGITIFRNGCNRAPILSKEKPDKQEKNETDQVPLQGNSVDDANVANYLPRGIIVEASDNVVGKKRKLVTGCGTLHVTAFFDPITGDLLETYLSKGSTGGCNNFMIGLSRLISLAARGGCDIHDIVDQLDSCGVCPSYAVRRATKHDTSKGSCCPMAVGNALLDMWNEMKSELEFDEPDLKKIEDTYGVDEADEDFNGNNAIVATSTLGPTIENSSLCPECHASLVHEGGCDVCKNCGYSKCQ